MQFKADSPAKIYAINSMVKETIMQHLNDTNIQFCSFAEKNTKRVAYIVRGLNIGAIQANINHIGTAITAIGITGNIQINRHLTPYMKRPDNNVSAVLYQVILDHDANVALLDGIKTINGFRVKIEKMKKSSITQCRKCQRFQHSSGQCAFDYRCVQCVSSHLPGRIQNPKPSGLSDHNMPKHCKCLSI